MLQELSIRNFAIIDDLSIQFYDGLTILSGETGAGKSIIINAFNLLLGSRASAKLIRTGEKKAELEALFKIPNQSRIAKLMRAAGYDAAEGLLIQRKILKSDRHRVYINGRLSTMQVLCGFTENLASISGQHAHQGLLKEDQHLLILDQFSNLLPLRQSVSSMYQTVLSLTQEFARLKKTKQHQNDQRDLLAFQKKEIQAAQIQPDEDDHLEKERLRLKNAETLYQAAYNSKEIIYDGDGAVIEQLDQVKKTLEKAAAIDGDLAPYLEGISETIYQMQDLSEGLRSYCDGIEFDSDRLEEIETRLALLTQLKRKYGGSLSAVLQKAAEIDRQLLIIEDVDAKIDSLQTRLQSAQKKMIDLAEALSAKRQKAAKKLCQSVEQELKNLKMAQTQFDIFFQRTKAAGDTNQYLNINGHLISETGLDQISFMIAPNPGEAIKSLVRIASGGELSRVVLALKAILAKSDSVETVVFDEVDAGIGGSVAEVVGKKLKSLAQHHQIICITHLPQIAKFADYHFKIEKIVSDGRTRTQIIPLADKERITEIARMLGGVEITQATLEHARELLAS
jgi:DNA repair protein RecN (Recombination protein N)